MTDATSALLQTIIWAGLLAALAVYLRRPLTRLAELMIRRIAEGAAVTVGPVALGEAPTSVRSGREQQATAEGPEGAPLDESIEETLLKRSYPECLDHRVYLVHEAEQLVPRTRQRTGRYRVRIWVEAYEASDLEDVERVTYRLHSTFPRPIIATTNKAKEFELWLNVWGEFTITAYVERTSKPNIYAFRYLDLPGRPPD